MIADILAPRVGAARKTDKYWVFGKEWRTTQYNDKRATGAPAERTRFAMSTDSYSLDSHALASDIAAEDAAEYSLGNLAQESVEFNTSLILLKREIELAGMLTDTAQVTQNTTLTGSNQWSDFAGSKPGVDVEAGKAALIKNGLLPLPNVLAMGYEVYQQLVNNPAIRRAVVVSDQKVVGRALNASDLAMYFGVPRVVVGAAVKGETSPSFVWGKHAILAHVEESASRKDASLAKTFVWTNSEFTGGNGFAVRRGPHSDVTAVSETVGVDFYYDQKITAVEGGYLIKDAVA